MTCNRIIDALLMLALFLGAGMSSFSAPSSGRQYLFTHIDRSGSGLSYNSVKCMMQDSRGFVWIGTYKGLNRYDGTRIKNYGRQEIGVHSDYISTLAEDSAGNILVGTDNGIVIYDYVMDNFRRPEGADILNDRVYAMSTDSRGNVWIGSRSQGLFVYDPETDRLKNVPLNDGEGLPIDNVYRIVIDSNDRMYLASYCDNIYSLDLTADSFPRAMEPGRIRIEPDSDFFEKDDVEGLCLNPKVGYLLYVASKRHGLCEVNTVTGAVTRLYALPNDSRPTAIQSYGRFLWLSTTSGLVVYNTIDRSARLLRYDSSDRFSLSDDYVNTVLVDDRDGLWVGTANEGVDYHGKHQDVFEKFHRTDAGESLEGSVVCDFAQDYTGKVWIATERMGLLQYNPLTGTLTRHSLQFNIDHINALLCTDRWLWIGYHGGICRMDITTGRVISYPHFVVSDEDVDNRVLDIFISSDDILYVATSIGVMRYDASSDKFVKVDCLGDGAIEHIVEDSRGLIWLASYSSGVWAYDRFNDTVAGHWCIKGGEGTVIPEMTSSMCIDEKGQVWAIGFSSGFFRFDSKINDFTAYDKTLLQSLPTEIFFSALSDSDCGLWLSSDRGLVKFDPASGAVSVFTSISGILDEDFRKSCIKLIDGTMLFGSEGGFIRFDPDEIKAGGLPIKVAVTDFVVGEEAVIPSSDAPLDININLAKKIKLKASSNSFGFSFATPSSGTYSDGRILCHLEGYDKDWIDISASREVYWYNIPSGSYTLKIASQNADGQYVEAHPDIKVDIMPKFWQSKVGISIIIFLALALCLAVFAVLYRRQEQKLRDEQEAARRESQKQMIQDKMSFFSNIVHEIKTPLTLMRTPLHNIITSELTPDLKEDLSIIRNSADYLEKLVRELLDFIRVEKHAYVLEYKNIDIVDRINYIAFNFSETARERNLKIKFSHPQDSIVIGVDPKAFDKIINNLLHNAVKYAEMNISLDIALEDGLVRIVFANDGNPIPQSRRSEIFKPFVQFSDSESGFSQSFGIGLPFARMLAELHGGSLVLSDRQETEFILTLPVKSAADFPEAGSTEEESLSAPDSSLPLLLLVEDNYDLQNYLKKKLKSEYNVLAVPSGEKALVMLDKYKVDMVLTDIVLQGMDGVELCEKIASDFETSHIPVMVLSGISSTDVKVKAMEVGAAMYIEKPFTLDYLLACIKGILGRREQLRLSWKADAGTILDVAPYGLVSRDEDFLRKLDRTVNENLGNPLFAVQQLEQAMCMSRSSLTRKMKGLLNATPVDYLRSRRLASAAIMLRRGQYRVNEICYAVGFSSPSYFARCFKKAYGMLPAEYAVSSEDGETASQESCGDSTTN